MARARRSAAFERALRIELLRTRAALERETIRAHGSELIRAVDPRTQIASWLPQSASGVVGQVSSLALRYPYLLSTAASFIATQTRHPARLLIAGVTAALIWRASRQRGTQD